MALEYGKKGREARGVPPHFLPQDGEVATMHALEKKKKFDRMKDAGELPTGKARKTLVLHLNNGATWIEPIEGAKYPKGIVAAVRVRKGLILIREDGSGVGFEGSLSEYPPKKKPGPKPKTPNPPEDAPPAE